MRIFSSLAGVAILLFLVLWQIPPKKQKKLPNIRGLCIVAPPNPTPSEAFTPIKQFGANWVAIVPYAFSRKNEPQVHFDHQRQWWGERTEGTAVQIQQAHQAGLNVMLKPHVWVRGDGWPGEYSLSSEADWKSWEEDYRKYILAHARLADSLQVALFCIGTEYRKAVVERPAFWKKLISEVREVYSGPLTYAANWDNYQQVSFWEELDYIGVDAYFPLDSARSPSTSTLVDCWETHKQTLLRFSRKHNRRLLFTEFGYQSTDYATAGHWLEVEGQATNTDLQATAYQAFFQSWAGEERLAGFFAWKWYLSNPENRRKFETGFTFQGKTAEAAVSHHYKAGRVD